MIQVEALAKEISELHQTAEKAGEEGNLDESMAAMQKADALAAKKKILENPGPPPPFPEAHPGNARVLQWTSRRGICVAEAMSRTPSVA